MITYYAIIYYIICNEACGLLEIKVVRYQPNLIILDYIFLVWHILILCSLSQYLLKGS